MRPVDGLCAGYSRRRRRHRVDRPDVHRVRKRDVHVVVESGGMRGMVELRGGHVRQHARLDHDGSRLLHMPCRNVCGPTQPKRLPRSRGLPRGDRRNLTCDKLDARGLRPVRGGNALPRRRGAQDGVRGGHLGQRPRRGDRLCCPHRLRDGAARQRSRNCNDGSGLRGVPERSVQHRIERFELCCMDELRARFVH